MITKSLILIRKFRPQFNRRQNKISLQSITAFFHQFSALITAGIPLIQTCDLLAATHYQWRLIMLAIKQETLAGKPLNQSLRKHPECFSPLICHLIEVGEHTGKLDLMLQMVAAHLEKQLALRRRIKQATFYPTIVLCAGICITLCLIIFVIPEFASLFNESPQTLPLLTKCIFSFSKQCRQFIGWPLIICGLIYFVLLRLMQPQKRQSLINQLLDTIPIINHCRQTIVLARFARTLAITYSAGIPIIEALRLASNASNHTTLIQLIAKARSGIASGLQLHQSLAIHPYFPRLMIEMIKTGEEAGMLDEMLLKIAAFYESDSEQQLDRFSRLLEPLIMLILGVLIGGLVIGMYLPIFKLGSLF